MILVTGAGGFVGSRVVDRLVSEGFAVRALVRNTATTLARFPAGVAIVAGDVTRPETLGPAFDGIDMLVHSAFITADRKQGPGVNYQATNVAGSRNVIEAARGAGVRHSVVVSGLGTKPSRPGSYMHGRYLGEQAVRESGITWSMVGASIQFGSGSAFIEGLTDLIRSAPVVPMVGSGRLRFQPIWVEDVVTCVVTMLKQPGQYAGRKIDIGGPEYLTYAEILDLLMETMHVHRLKIPAPVPAVVLGAHMMELLLAKPPITVAATDLFAFDNITTLDAVQREFGFSPRSLRDYLRERGVS